MSEEKQEGKGKGPMPHIMVDADACPVKQEILRVARRYDLYVTFIANVWMNVPKGEKIEFILVKDEFDAADDWIVEHAETDDIIITTDILLASRCIEKNARVLTPKGRIYTTSSIGDAVARRELMSGLREMGVISGNQAPFGNKNRSKFLQSLDEVIQTVFNKKPR